MNSATQNMIGQFLEPVFQTLPASAAREIVSIAANESLQVRVRFLAERSNEGELTEAESEEYQTLIDAGDIMATLQAIARKTLRNADK